MADIEPIRWSGGIRFWEPAKSSGLAVVDVPSEHIPAIGGLKQQRVRGRLGGEPFTSSVMPAGGGRLALSVSKAMMTAARVAVGDAADVAIEAVGKD
jgi:hypothetical protein